MRGRGYVPDTRLPFLALITADLSSEAVLTGAQGTVRLSRVGCCLAVAGLLYACRNGCATRRHWEDVVTGPSPTIVWWPGLDITIA